MKRGLAVAAAFLMANLCLADNVVNKSERTDAVFNVLKELHRCAAETNARAGADRNQVKHVIDQIRNPEELGMLAMICRIIAEPGRAEENAFDSWFHQAFLECLYKLRDMEDPNALTVLMAIAKRMNFDGGDSLTVRAAIEDQKSKPRSR